MSRSADTPGVPGAAAPASPGVAAPVGVFAALQRSGALRAATGTWAALALALAVLDDRAAQVPGWFAWGLGTLVLPALVLFTLVALPALPFVRLRRVGIAAGAVLATLVALGWALVVGLGVAWFGSPYGLIPWLGDDSIAGFARRHPELSVSTLPIDTMVRDAAGHAVELHPLDLPGATFAFEPCDAPPLPDRLGGLPTPPLPCVFRYRLERDGHLRQVFVFARETERPNDRTPLPYADWARARGAEFGGSRGGAGRRSAQHIELRAGERDWHVRVVTTRYSEAVLIAEGGGPLRLPAR